jgi:hypothetical protein
MFRLPLRPNQPPIQLLPGTLSTGVGRPECEADHSPLFRIKVKKHWRYTSTHSHDCHAMGQLDLLLVSFDSLMFPITAINATVAKCLQGLVCFILGVYEYSCMYRDVNRSLQFFQ